jgi:hypothetical protein
MPRPLLSCVLAVLVTSQVASAQTSHQPKVRPGANEPDLEIVLKNLYGLRMFDDLLNPVATAPEAAIVHFRRSGADEVVFTPILALGLEVAIRGGYYIPDPKNDVEVELWHYVHKSTAAQVEAKTDLRPPLRGQSRTRFDPGGDTFGLWIGNDQFKDRVYTDPARVAKFNKRLAKQPYKAMVYPVKDPKTGKDVPNSYLIGWEYSTNDDFQDVVCRIDNVVLVPSPEHLTR